MASASKARQRRLCRGLFALVVLFFASGSTAKGSEVASAEEGLDRLGGLVGTWEIVDSDKDFRIEFDLVAGDSVLVETWYSGTTKRSLTLYHLDGERLMATHYCPQGNQPRLVAKPSSDSARLSFEYFDATNLEDPAASHQHSLSFDFSDPSGIVKRSETYRQGEKEEASTLLLERRQR